MAEHIGTHMPTILSWDLELAALDLQQRLLHRLPESLWDQSRLTPQGQLYGAIAQELARWLETWTIVRDSTLLQRASGVDLDLLLTDYRLKRYNHRSDAFAREIARLILGTPKGSLYSLQDLTQLLVDTPQLCARSGRWQPHWWTAITRPITMARTYWQLGDQLGKMWYVSLAQNEITISDLPPPGANTTPWPDGYVPVPGGPPPFAGGNDDVMPVYWFHLEDETGALWYFHIGEGGEAAISLERPGPEPGTTEPMRLWDGQGEVWGVMVDRQDFSLRVIPFTSPLLNPTFWTVIDDLDQAWLLFMREGALTLARLPAPLLWREMTPGGVPLAWWRITEEGAAAPRYAHVLHQQVIVVTETQPDGPGTTEELLLRDVEDQSLWRGDLDTTGRDLEMRPAPEIPLISGDPIVMLDPGHIGQYVQLVDGADQTWYVWRTLGGGYAVGEGAPPHLVDATPPGGPYRWWRLEALDGSASAVWIEAGPCLKVGRPQPNGAGMDTPVALGDYDNVLWHDGITPDGALAGSNAAPLEFTQAPTCLILNDEDGRRWFWAVNPHTGSLIVSEVLGPRVIPWQPVGELGWIRAADPHGGPPWYLMATRTHAVKVRHAPMLAQPWGLDARECLLYDDTGRPWQLTIGADGGVKPLPLYYETIPAIQPTLYVRECAEALRHIEAGGSLTTLYAI